MKQFSIFQMMLFISLFIIACNSATNTSDNPTKPKAFQFPDTEISKKLVKNYHTNPINQDQIDENKLIEYAVTNNLDVTKTKTGLYHLITLKNKSANFTHNQPIAAHYRGKTLNGNEFDSSYKRGQPLQFKVGQMIKGWNEALVMMNRGAKATLLIPSKLAYGTTGFPGFVGPNEPLIFEVEIPDTF